MAGKRRPKVPQAQEDLFSHAELFPVRSRPDGARPVDLSLKIKTALGRALKEAPDSAEMIAAKMAELGTPITGDALYALTAPSKSEHQISLLRAIIFVRATGAKWLWDLFLEDDGLVVLEEGAARLAQLGHLRQEHQRLTDELKRLERGLKAEPVRIARRRPGAR